MFRFSLAALVALTACASVPDSEPGQILDYNGEVVTIRGPFPTDGSVATATPAMIENARTVCPNARYLTAAPYDDWSFVYKFAC